MLRIIICFYNNKDTYKRKEIVYKINIIIIKILKNITLFIINTNYNLFCIIKEFVNLIK